MNELQKKLEAILTELQDMAGKVQDEIDNFDSEDENETSPWEDCKSYLDEACDAVENAQNSWPAE